MCATPHWAILSLQQGAELDFDTKELMLVYNNVLAQLTSLDTTHLKTYFTDIWACGKELQCTLQVEKSR